MSLYKITAMLMLIVSAAFAGQPGISSVVIKKKTNRPTGHQDIIDVVEGLNRSRGTAQWEFIRDHFDVDELIDSYAVSMCIQDWDGYFNNDWAYHDLGPAGVRSNDASSGSRYPLAAGFFHEIVACRGSDAFYSNWGYGGFRRNV